MSTFSVKKNETFITSGKTGRIENTGLGQIKRSGKLNSKDRCLHFTNFELESRIEDENFTEIAFVNFLSDYIWAM